MSLAGTNTGSTPILPNLIQNLPQTQADWQQLLNQLQQWQAYIQGLINGIQGYQAAFQSGQIPYAGPNSSLISYIGFQLGLNLPNPTGTPGPGLLLGSGPTQQTFTILQDQAYTAALAGNNLIITSGETQGSGTANGGYLLVTGGGSFGGTGGTTTLQGGTSANGTGGQAILAGGNSTTGGIPGDAFVIGGGGMAPAQGANVHLIMTKINGVSGVIRFRVNSTPIFDFNEKGGIFCYLGSNSYGLAGQPLVSGGAAGAATWQTGFTGTIVTKALTTTNGSMTFASGILISQVAAT